MAVRVGYRRPPITSRRFTTLEEANVIIQSMSRDMEELRRGLGRVINKHADSMPVHPEDFLSLVSDGEWQVAVQAAFDTMKVSGGIVSLLPRSYRIATGVTLDLSGFSDDTDELGVSIIGAGSGATELLWAGGAGNCLTVQGGSTGAELHLHSLFQGFKITPTTVKTGTGLKVDMGAFAQFEDLFLFKMDRGMDLTDVLSSRFFNCRYRLNNEGLMANANVAVSSPNALDFYGCHFGSNSEFGASFINPANVSFFGGSIESNGVTGIAADRFGLKLLNAGPAGGLGLSVYGTYFERNVDKADIWLVQGANEASYMISGANFNRVSSSDFVTNNIRVDQGVLDGDGKLTLSGCAFNKYNTYVANSGRPYVKINDNGNFDFDDPGTFYEDSIERPVKPSGQLFARCRFNGTGSPPTPTREVNVASISKTAAGDYTLTFKRAGRMGTKEIAGSVNGVGFITKFAEGTGSVRVRIYSDAGALTDFTVISVFVYE